MHKDLQFTAVPFAEITKSYRDGNGQMFIEGLASTVDIDLQGERMSPEVIAKMAARMVGKPLREEHQKGYLNKLGEIVQADVINDDQNRPALWIKARLYDWSSAGRDTFQAIKSGVKLGLSVAGRIKPGGLVKELAEHLGKYIPTYKDVEPTEVSVTDHPANLATFALAVSKSFEEEQDKSDEYDPEEFVREVVACSCPTNECKHNKGLAKADTDVTNAPEDKPKEFADVPSDKFLDPENHTYPADDKHLLPALKYFNHTGQREAGGYSPDQWQTMGKKLVRLLSAKTGDTYSYDPDSQTITQQESETTKEVNTMDKGKLVSKQYNDDVKKFASEWGRDLSREVKKAEPVKQEIVAKVEDAKTEEVKKDASQSDIKTASTDVAEKAVAKPASSSLESLLSSINSSLSDIKSSMDSARTSTSMDAKAMDQSSTSDESSMKDVMRAMTQAIDTMKQLVAKKKQPAASSTETASDSTSETLGKTITELVSVITDLKKSNDDLKKSYEELPRQRKGYAIAIEKKFEGHTDQQAFDPAMLDILTKDQEIGFKELHLYKDYGILPGKYAEKKAA